MSFFDKVKGAINSGRDELTRQVGRFKNKKFMHGTVAVCARIAVSSDGVSSEEKQKMMGFLRSSEELKVFDTNEGDRSSSINWFQASISMLKSARAKR